MPQAATLQHHEVEDGEAVIVRRLLARPFSTQAGVPSFTSLAAPLAAPLAALPPRGREAAEEPSAEATILVLKAVLRSEREEVAALQAELAELRDAHRSSRDARAGRERRAGLVERLVRSPR